ncbi:hypothetical protein [Haloarcula sp. K1]|uniref:hypothetical protein n=1 Tax=Haloarcula sp. K1 TaxID=1622207 RepID=UPI0007BB2211|nr:hypothetical protein [Haloarcula sp. K1]KZX46239.1 hypothetical protein AV929_15825 [Haloarcula sp. K1]
MANSVKRVGLTALLMSLMVFTTFGASVGTVAAQCEDPTNVDNCEGGMDQYVNMLDNVYEVAHTTLQYAGFVAVFAGAVLWFTARRSSDRAQTGVWLLIGGLIMIVFYFGFTAFVSLLKWIAEGG